MESMELDNFDLDNIGDLSDLDDVDLSSFGEIDSEISEDHVKIVTKDLQKVLRIAKLMSAASGRDIVSKSVAFKVEGDVLSCRVTDFDSYFEQRLELLNNQNVLEEEFVIPIDILMKLIKACGTTLAILKDDEGLKMRLVGGDIILETYNIPLDKFILEDSFERISEVEAPQLLDIVRSMSPIVTAAVNPTERRILFKEGNAYASYMWALIKSIDSYPEFELKIKDLSIMRVLLVDLESSIEIGKSKGDTKVDRIRFCGEDFEYATIVSDIDISSLMVSQMEEILEGPCVHIDLVQLYKMVEVSADLPYSVGRLGLNYSEEGVDLSIKTKKGKDSMFSLGGSFEGRVEPLSKEIILQAKLLRILLRSFSGDSSVKLFISQKGLGIESSSFQACCFTEG